MEVPAAKKTDSVSAHNSSHHSNSRYISSSHANTSANTNSSKSNLTANQNGKNDMLSKLTPYFWVLLIGLISISTLIIPITNNFISQTKWLLTVGLGFITLIWYAIRSMRRGSWQITITPVTIPLALFLVASLASSLFNHPYPQEHLLGLGGIYLSTVVIAVLGGSLLADDFSNQPHAKNSSIKSALNNGVTAALAVGAGIVSIATLLELVGYGPTKLLNLMSGLNIQNTLLLNLAGSPLAGSQLILVSLVATLKSVFDDKKLNTWQIIAIPILVLGLGLHIWSMLPGQEAALSLPPVAASWKVALDSVEAPKNAVIGQGPEGYVNAYMRYKPTWMNGRDNWQITYGSAAGMPLTLLVQLGFLGLIIWIATVFRFFKNRHCSSLRSQLTTWIIGLIFCLQLISPPSTTLLAIQAILLAIWTAVNQDKFNSLKINALHAEIATQTDRNHDDATKKPKGQESKLFSTLINGLVLAGSLFLLFHVGRAYASHYQLLQASKAVTANKGVQVYEHQRRAVALNPFVDYVHRDYALTNLQIAIALTNKADITDQERQQVGILIQQAAREGRNATTLDPMDSRNWQVLAQIYQELIGSAEGAAQLTIDSYVNAIQTQPTNPLLRIRLGNVLLGQENTTQAVSVLERAVELKPDLPASYFYLGQAYRQNQQLVQARAAWQQAQLLIDQNSEDYQILSQGLEQLEAELKEATSSTGVRTQTNQAGSPTTPNATTPGADDATVPATDQNLEGQETPLSKELPSLTDQAIQEVDQQDITTDNEPLELSEESEEAINENLEPTGTEEPAVE